MSEKKKVVVQLPRQAQSQTLEERYALELEALAPLAEIVEVEADTPEQFAEAAADADALITSWGIDINETIVSRLEKCAVIGVGHEKILDISALALGPKTAQHLSNVTLTSGWRSANDSNI